jgi:hypothetical protein
MTWSITFHDEFSPEFKKFPEAVRVEMLATLKFVKQDGPLARRPAVGFGESLLPSTPHEQRSCYAPVISPA